MCFISYTSNITIKSKFFIKKEYNFINIKNLRKKNQILRNKSLIISILAKK